MCPAIVWYRTTCQSVGVLVIIQEQQKKKRDGTLGVCVCVNNLGCHRGGRIGRKKEMIIDTRKGIVLTPGAIDNNSRVGRDFSLCSFLHVAEPGNDHAPSETERVDGV